MIGIAVFDIKERRIPNLLVGFILFLQVIKAFLSENQSGYKDNISGCLLLLIAGYMISYFGFIGAGDIKLLVAILVGIPAGQWVGFFVITIVIAAAWSLAVLYRHHMFRERFFYLKNYIKYMRNFKVPEQYWSKSQGKTHTIPLSIPMILGYLCTMGGGNI